MNETGYVGVDTEPAQGPTEYVVLRLLDGDWQEIGRFNASAAHGAVRAAAKNYQSAEPATFVAIPARSWKPVTVKAEQQTVIKLEAAT